MLDLWQPSPHLIVPGWAGSGADHWQTYWQADLEAPRVEMADWMSRDYRDWVDALDVALGRLAARTSRPPVLVAHSLGCIAIAHWARTHRRPIRAALLVAPADVERAPALDSLREFGPIPLRPLPFSSFVVASDDDPHVSLERAELFATRWGSQFEVVARGGHLNAASRLGDWPQGREHLARLLRRTQLSRAG